MPIGGTPIPGKRLAAARLRTFGSIVAQVPASLDRVSSHAFVCNVVAMTAALRHPPAFRLERMHTGTRVTTIEIDEDYGDASSLGIDGAETMFGASEDHRDGLNCITRARNGHDVRFL
ncbi:hypothetical protein [Methylobacterium sp. Leaf100]|uniref:hypothetical protein n=1 Tax=Methylobacterium sp. Leaf100 TaxID=1736252 RepID=UPI0006FB8C89|nr:hypothetical protein [Methylobacterium sp. Leaf100]KQP36879.1 hypothetical protein ASF25_02770 [Methylobacterium sp. Leaf100]